MIIFIYIWCIILKLSFLLFPDLIILRQTKMIKYDSESCLLDEDFGYMPFHIERNGTSCTNINQKTNWPGNYLKYDFLTSYFYFLYMYNFTLIYIYLYVMKTN